jgi:hypothetical protein
MVIKSSVDKSLSKLMKNCFRIDFFQTCAFFKKIHGMCKHRLMVVFHILFQNVYSLF